MTRIFISLFLSLFITGQALAHSKVSGSTPASGDTVEVGLETLNLTFDKKVRLTRVTLYVGEDGMDLETLGEAEVKQLDALKLTSKLPKGFTDEADFDFDALGAGNYRLHWIAVAQDGHVIEGDVVFSVAE